MHPRTRYLLTQIGVAPIELEHLGKPMFHPIPHRSSGYGLIGGTGAVKTSQLVHRLAESIEVFVVKNPNPAEAKFPFYPFARWLSWPEEVEKLKRMSATNGHQELDRLISIWKEAGALYLDDIGQERVSSDRDYGQGVFAEIVDARYRHKRPVFWTSNLDEVQLTTKYGARLMSRMFTAWPFIKVTTPDQRLLAMRKKGRAS